MPSELELAMLERLETLEKEIARLKRRMSDLKRETSKAARRAPEGTAEKKGGSGDVKKK